VIAKSFYLSELHRLAEQALLNAGCDASNASSIAHVMVLAERDGCRSHGMFRLPGYIASLGSGKVNGNAHPRVMDAGAAVIRVDGDGGYAPLALHRGLPALIDAARSHGVAALAISRIFHFAALWPEVEQLADAGLASLAFVASKAAVAPAGASRAFFGTNPLAFGWPDREGEHLIFDMATSAMARGDIQIAARDRQRVGAGVGLDNDGAPTLDPQAIIAGGVQLPFGGYKGSSLSLMVELLAAGLLGEQFGFEAKQSDNGDGGPTRGGELIIALDPRAFGDADHWHMHCQSFFGTLMTLDGVRLPAQRRRQHRQQAVSDGVELAQPLYEQLLTYLM